MLSSRKAEEYNAWINNYLLKIAQVEGMYDELLVKLRKELVLFFRARQPVPKYFYTNKDSVSGVESIYNKISRRNYALSTPKYWMLDLLRVNGYHLQSVPRRYDSLLKDMEITHLITDDFVATKQQLEYMNRIVTQEEFGKTTDMLVPVGMTRKLADILTFALSYHKGQMRSEGDMVSYIYHPIRVMTQLVSLGYRSETILGAALLHDVIEDCGASEYELRTLFGSEIAELVVELSDTTQLYEGNRARRKALYVEHLRTCSKDAAIIKCVDIMDNIESLSKYKPEFYPVWRLEAIDILNVLKSKVPPQIYKLVQEKLN